MKWFCKKLHTIFTFRYFTRFISLSVFTSDSIFFIPTASCLFCPCKIYITRIHMCAYVYELHARSLQWVKRGEKKCKNNINNNQTNLKDGCERTYSNMYNSFRLILFCELFRMNTSSIGCEGRWNAYIQRIFTHKRRHY